VRGEGSPSGLLPPKPDGKTYIEVSPSSTFDASKSSRPRDTWGVRRNGKMYIEASDIQKIYTFQKD